MEEARAVAKYIRIAPRKARVVADLIRGKSVDEALAILRYTPKIASEVLEKVVKSAAANATHNYEMDRDNLYISAAYVDVGPTLKRFQPRQRGQAFSIKKRTSHITVVVSQRSGERTEEEEPRRRPFARRPGVRRGKPAGEPAPAAEVKAEGEESKAKGKSKAKGTKGKAAPKKTAARAPKKTTPAKKATAPAKTAAAKPKAEKKTTGRQGKGE